jgi:hypothetical protein
MNYCQPGNAPLRTFAGDGAAAARRLRRLGRRSRPRRTRGNPVVGDIGASDIDGVVVVDNGATPLLVVSFSSSEELSLSYPVSSLFVVGGVEGGAAVVVRLNGHSHHPLVVAAAGADASELFDEEEEEEEEEELDEVGTVDGDVEEEDVAAIGAEVTKGVEGAEENPSFVSRLCGFGVAAAASIPRF